MVTATEKPKIVYNQPSGASWDIPEVSYRGETSTYRLFEEMTENMNQERHAEFYNTEKQKGNPHPTDMPLIWAIFTSAY